MGIVTTDSKNYSNIADKIREKAGTDATYKPEEMPNGIDEVYSAGQSSMVDESKLIPKTVSGSYISVDDVSEIPHSVGCKVESVNLCPVNDRTFTTSMWYEYDPPLPAGRYTMSGKFATEHPDNQVAVLFQNADRMNATNSYLLFDIPDNGEYSGSFIAYEPISWIFWYAANGYNNALNYKASIANFQLNRGDTVLPYTPFVNPETVTVTRCGANLVCFSKKWSGTSSGISSVVNDDGSIVVNGTATSLRQFISNEITWFANTDVAVTVSFAESSKSGVQASITPYDENGATLGTNYFTSSKTVTIPSNCRKISVSLFVTAGTTVENYTFYPMLNIGATALPYEPYNEQALIPKADGTVEGMTSVSPYMNIFTDNVGATLEATYRMSWGMQEERERFYNDFAKGKINVSISFEWLALDKTNTTSVINALSATTTGQTLTLNLSAVNAAFETSSGAKDGSTSTEFAALIATKTNWTIVLK